MEAACVTFIFGWLLRQLVTHEPDQHETLEPTPAVDQHNEPEPTPDVDTRDTLEPTPDVDSQERRELWWYTRQ
eukprot:82698-Heterocapsa_arctica.AAC.1